MQTLARMNGDIEKFRMSASNIDAKMCPFYHHKNEYSPQQNKALITCLKEEKSKLLSIGLQFNISNIPKPSKAATPNHHSKKKIYPKYSSAKKPRPRIRKTPLKPLNPVNIANINNLNNNNNNNLIQNKNKNIKKNQNEVIQSNNINTKIPQKKLHVNLAKFSTNKNIKNLQNINNTNNTLKMDIDNGTDGDSENEENIAPLNLMTVYTKSMVDIKVEQIRKQKEKQKPKPKVDALQQAKFRRMEQEKREKERKKQKELTQKTIQENKRKKKLLEQQKYRQKQQKQRPSKKKQIGNNNGNRKQVTNKNNKPKGNKHKNAKNINMPNIKKTRFNIQPNNSTNNSKFNQINSKFNPIILPNNTNNKEKKEKKESGEYPISDYDSDFDSDSDVDEENCGKFIPVWARKSNPRQAINRQKAIDPDIIFGRMNYKSCDLEIVFKDFPSRTKYRQRSASGDWSKDLISWSEENGYKKKMGWI